MGGGGMRHEKDKTKYIRFGLKRFVGKVIRRQKSR